MPPAPSPLDRSSAQPNVDNCEISDPGSEDEAQFEIDEQSDGEDERQAHALLRAAPSPSVALVEQTPSVVTQHSDRGFAVCSILPNSCSQRIY